jgi:hypothetical protein
MNRSGSHESSNPTGRENGAAFHPPSKAAIRHHSTFPVCGKEVRSGAELMAGHSIKLHEKPAAVVLVLKALR